MKIRRFIVAVLAASLIVCACFSTGAQAETILSYPLAARKVLMNTYTNTMAVRLEGASGYMLMTADGMQLSDAVYMNMNPVGTMYEIILSGGTGINDRGLMDSSGNIVVPMEYTVLRCLSDEWQIATRVEKTSDANYDYKMATSDGTNLYIISAHDIYYNGTMIGSLERVAFSDAEAHGKYLYVRDKEGGISYFDSAFNESDYQSTTRSTREYEKVDGAVWHAGSNQQAFTPDCTLSSEDVELDIYEVDGRFVDLQGNVLFEVSEDYETVMEFGGDYAKVRKDGKYGLIDRSGREVLPCEYDDIPTVYGDYFPGGYQAVVKDGKIGFVDTANEGTFKYSSSSVSNNSWMPFNHISDPAGGLIVLSAPIGELPDRYENVQYYRGCPVAIVQDAQGMVGLVDMYGEMAIPMTADYDSVSDFTISNDGTLAVGRTVDGLFMVYLFENIIPEEKTAEQAEEQPSEAAEQPAADPEPVSQDEPAGEASAPSEDGSWTCACGNVNKSKFCTECGSPAPEPEPSDDGSWTCACGSVNKSKFCTECGTPRPPEKLVCAKCGYEPADGTTPKFCTECGNAFGG